MNVPKNSRPVSLRLMPSLALLLLALQGCGLMAQKAAEQDPLIDATSGDIVVQATFPKSVFRPGESVVSTVTITNTTKAPLTILAPAAESGPPATAAGPITFWYGPQNTLDRFQRFPVISSKEAASRGPRGGDTIQLGAGESISRPFLLTRITDKPGKYVFQVQVQPFPSKEIKRIGRFYSDPMFYEVYGPRLFARDSKGLIELEEAIRIAAAEAPGDIHLMDAVLIEDEMGFYRWWVNVDYQAPDKVYVRKAYLVDPYIGRIWSEAKQFPSKLKRDAGRVRYDEVRRMRERAKDAEPGNVVRE